LSVVLDGSGAHALQTWLVNMTAEEQVTELNAERTLDTIFADQSHDLPQAEQIY